MGDRNYTLPYNSGTESHVSENLEILKIQIQDLIFKVKDLEKVIEMSDNASRAADRLQTKQENAIEEQIKDGKDAAEQIVEQFEECVRQLVYKVLHERQIAIIPGEGIGADLRETEDVDVGDGTGRSAAERYGAAATGPVLV